MPVISKAIDAFLIFMLLFGTSSERNMTMPAIRHDDVLLRLIKDVSYIRSILNRVTVNLPLYDLQNENTPTQIDSDENNYNPGYYDVLRLASDVAGRTITGFRGGVKGRFLRLFNVGNYEIILANQSASSTAANRIVTPTGFDLILNAGGEIALYYDATQSRWISSYSSNTDRISVELQLAGAQSIGNAAYTPISWTTEVLDTGNFFDAATPTYITIPETGWYNISVNIAWDASAGGNHREVMVERSTSSPYLNIMTDARYASNVAINVNLSRQYYFDIGEKIYVTVWQNSGGNLNVAVNGPRQSATRIIVTKM